MQTECKSELRVRDGAAIGSTGIVRADWTGLATICAHLIPSRHFCRFQIKRRVLPYSRSACAMMRWHRLG